MLSILSNIPPCPGIKFPKSFIPAVLFMADADKSPIWLNILSVNVINDMYTYDIFIFPNLFIQYVYIKEIIIAPIVPPIDPSIDFFGLIFVNLCFPKFTSYKICKCICSPCCN